MCNRVHEATSVLSQHTERLKKETPHLPRPCTDRSKNLSCPAPPPGAETADPPKKNSSPRIFRRRFETQAVPEPWRALDRVQRRQWPPFFSPFSSSSEMRCSIPTQPCRPRRRRAATRRSSVFTVVAVPRRRRGTAGGGGGQTIPTSALTPHLPRSPPPASPGSTMPLHPPRRGWRRR